jgi:hypothetical protein
MAANPGHCAACGFSGDVQEHHIVPRAYGGRSRPTVYLCDRCHAATHSRTWSNPHHAALTRAGIDAARARGTRLGNPGLDKVRGKAHAGNRAAADRFAANVLPIIAPMRAEGASLRKIAEALNERRIPTARGGMWASTQVGDILKRGEPQLPYDPGE